MISGSLAKRYARALIEAAGAQNRDKYLQNLADFTAACKTKDPDDPSGAGWGAREGQLLEVLSAGHIKMSQRRAILSAVLGRLGADATIKKFFELVLDCGRIGGVEQIHLHYRELADEAAGRVRAKVLSATALDPSTTGRIKAALEQATGKQVLLETEVAPELIGGLVAHVGSHTLDRSVRTSLDKLRSSLRA